MRADDDAAEIRNRTCQECGMLLDQATEFHPWVFCVIKKAGHNPWEEIIWVVEALGIDATHWPLKPPLVRDLPVCDLPARRKAAA